MILFGDFVAIRTRFEVPEDGGVIVACTTIKRLSSLHAKADPH